MNDINHINNPEVSEMTEVTSQAKRRLLSSLGAGGSVLGIGALVPATWVKPVANAVILPVHAQTTEPEPLDAATIAAASPAAPTSFFPLRGGGRRDGIRIRWTNPETPLGDGVDLYRARYRLMGETGNHLVLGFRPLAENGANDKPPDAEFLEAFLILPDDDLSGNPARVSQNAMYEIQVEAIYYEEGNDTPPASHVQGQFLSPTVTVTPGAPT